MNIAMTIVDGNLAPLFPGAKLKIKAAKNEGNENLPEVKVNGYALT